jgi:hypothetical protein
MKPPALRKLPDRHPVKRTIACEPELNKALEEYALFYREAYGETEPIETLMPFMLSTFLAKDRAFMVFRKTRAAQTYSDGANHPDGGRRRRRGRPSAEPDVNSSS